MNTAYKTWKINPSIILTTQFALMNASKRIVIKSITGMKK